MSLCGHLDREQKRELIAQQLRETPQLSNRQIAESLGTSHPAVAAVRTELEESGEVERFTTSIGSDGKEYPATQPERPGAYRYIHGTPAGQDAVVQSAKEVRAGPAGKD